jgi:nucleoside-diphosphate-sugar epimerase
MTFSACRDPASRQLAMEERPFRPLPAFAWMVPHLRGILEAREINGIVIRPAMVYEPGGGVFHRFVLDAVERDAIRVVRSEQVRWPLVHSEDLANLYALAAARPPRSSYIGAATKGLPSAASHALLPTRRMGEGLCPRPAAEWREGAARSRLEAEASRPGT